MSFFPSSLDFARTAVPFLRAFPHYLRNVPGDPSFKYYGSGESGHWAVQINQQVAGALACLASLPQETLSEAGCAQSADELRALALAMSRYSLRTHCTGDLDCTDGKRWGRHWISVLGYERMISGLDLLRPFFTADDEARLNALVECECKYRMNEYELVADPDASTGHNKPESNIWNGAFLLRAAADMTVAPSDIVSAWRERGTDYLVNGLSFPDDAEDETMVLGKPVRERFIGANFFPDGALDHHGYLNVGYAYVCLSNLALLYFSFKQRGLPAPDGFMHNLRRVWEWCKLCTFPDGRLLRIGGDSRARYTYCQCFALQGWHLAWELWHDEDAAAFAHGYLNLVAKEQSENPDGTFYGRRLSSMRNESPWWETRLECDPFTVLATSAYWAADLANEAARCDEKRPNIGAAGFSPLWIGSYHGAALLRTPNAVRSVVARAFSGPTRPNARNFHETGPAALCVPPSRSDMAEWSGNLFAFVGLRGPKHIGTAAIEQSPGGFRWRWEGDILEDNPLGEGESAYPVLHRVCTAETLPDGCSMRFSDYIKCIKETTLPAGFRALHLQIPNDIYNDFKRSYLGEGSTEITIDNAIAVRSLSGHPLCVYRNATQGALTYNGLTSLNIEEICTIVRKDAVHLLPGEILCDERYEVEVLPINN